MIVRKVFLSILNQMEFHWIQNRMENCHHDHIPLNLKGNGNIVFSVYAPQPVFTWIRATTQETMLLHVKFSLKEHLIVNDNYFHHKSSIHNFEKCNLILDVPKEPPPPAAFPSLQMVLKLLLCHEGTEYELSFEIGQREGGFYSARIDRHTQ